MNHLSSPSTDPPKPSESTGAQAAVLKPSDPVSEDARIVQGVEFNDHQNAPITVEEMVANMSSMGFQASAVADAVRVVDDMVGEFCFSSLISHFSIIVVLASHLGAAIRRSSSAQKHLLSLHLL